MIHIILYARSAEEMAENSDDFLIKSPLFIADSIYCEKIQKIILIQQRIMKNQNSVVFTRDYWTFSLIFNNGLVKASSEISRHDCFSRSRNISDPKLSLRFPTEKKYFFLLFSEIYCVSVISNWTFSKWFPKIRRRFLEL